MSYIGVQPTAGQYRQLDDISSGFNGSTTSFTTAVGGENVTATTAQQLLVSLGGVIQEPNVDYTTSTYSITFTTAPSSGLDFFAVLMGDAINIGEPADGTVTPAKLAANFSGATGAYGSNDSVFFLNQQTVTTDYTLPAGFNAGTFGPCTINSGVTVTIPSGQSWVII